MDMCLLFRWIPVLIYVDQIPFIFNSLIMLPCQFIYLIKSLSFLFLQVEVCQIFDVSFFSWLEVKSQVLLIPTSSQDAGLWRHFVCSLEIDLRVLGIREWEALPWYMGGRKEGKNHRKWSIFTSYSCSCIPSNTG